MTRPAKFTQADIRRAARALAKLGEDVTLRLHPDGTIEIARRRAGDKSWPDIEDREPLVF